MSSMRMVCFMKRPPGIAGPRRGQESLEVIVEIEARQEDHDRGPLTFSRVDGESATALLDEKSDDRQADAEAGRPSRSGAVKESEEFVAEVGVHTDAVVLDTEFIALLR